MSEDLKKHGFEDPLKNEGITRQRFTIQARTAYIVFDNKKKVVMNKFLDYDQSLEARYDAEKERKQCEEQYGATYVD